MKITRKQALIIFGTWMTCALGKWTKAESGNTFINQQKEWDNVTFKLSQYKKIVVEFEDQKVELTTKEVFEALSDIK